MIYKGYSDDELEQQYQELKKQEDRWTKVHRDEDSVWVEHKRACEICGKRYRFGTDSSKHCNIQIISGLLHMLERDADE